MILEQGCQTHGLQDETGPSRAPIQPASNRLSPASFSGAAAHTAHFCMFPSIMGGDIQSQASFPPLAEVSFSFPFLLLLIYSLQQSGKRKGGGRHPSWSPLMLVPILIFQLSPPKYHQDITYWTSVIL